MSAWTALAERYRPLSGPEGAEIRDEWPVRLEPVDGSRRAELFEGCPDALAKRIALIGPSDALETVAAIEPLLTAALDSVDPQPSGDDARYAVTVLSMGNALRCGGVRADGADDERERRWLSAIDPAAQSGVRRGRDHAAIAAAACGLPEVARTAAAEGPESFDPAAVFGCELSPFAAHLALAQQAGAGRDGVEPAWQSFLRNFPGEEAARTVQWLDLLWAARAVYAVLGDTPIAEVGARLHAEVLG